MDGEPTYSTEFVECERLYDPTALKFKVELGQASLDQVIISFESCHPNVNPKYFGLKLFERRKEVLELRVEVDGNLEQLKQVFSAKPPNGMIDRGQPIPDGTKSVVHVPVFWDFPVTKSDDGEYFVVEIDPNPDLEASKYKVNARLIHKSAQI